MNKKIRLIIVTITLILGVLLINQLKYRNDELYAVNLKNKIDKNLVSILVSDKDGNYNQYESDTFPNKEDYTYNSELSKCQDNNGNVINGILSYDEGTGKISIRTKKTTYCYLYFDKKSGPISEELIASGELWQSGLEGDGYRYTGNGGITCSYDNGGVTVAADNQDTTPSCPTLYNYTETRISSASTLYYYYQPNCPSNTSTYTYSCTELNGTIIPDSINNSIPNNFICFGTNNLEECKANEEKYMYRIIGVFPDESGKQHLKLIKYKQLPTAYAWHSDIMVNISWEESDLYKGLNGISGGSYSNLFIGNTTYDYLQDKTWLNKIADWKWTATNTLSCGEDGSCNETTSGPDYSSITTKQMYLHEMNRTKPTEECKNIFVNDWAGGTCDFSIGKWTYPVAKIGLMYVSDYQMGLGSSSLSMTNDNDYKALQTGWLNQNNNDTAASSDELFMSRFGKWCDSFFLLFIDSFGVLSYDESYVVGVRPVFYLDSTVTKLDGTGSYSSPYLISN